MKKYIILLSLSLNFLFCEIILASQSIPALIVNHQTKECAIMFTGDECMSCSAPEGWEVIGDEFSSKCPANYHMHKSGVSGKCKGHKTQFCCTVMHSGARGYCADVVVNESNKSCAFVDNIQECKQLPQGWEKASAQKFWGPVCPSLEYQWLPKELNCITNKD